MYEEVNTHRLTESLVNAESYFKMREKIQRWRVSSHIFKLYFAKMVLAKEEALSQLARAKQVLTELKAEVEKTNLAVHASVDQGMNILFL